MPTAQRVTVVVHLDLQEEDAWGLMAVAKFRGLSTHEWVSGLVERALDGPEERG